jgi:hypothetical protein
MPSGSAPLVLGIVHSESQEEQVRGMGVVFRVLRELHPMSMSPLCLSGFFHEGTGPTVDHRWYRAGIRSRLDGLSVLLTCVL